jgi:hypothetical protein
MKNENENGSARNSPITPIVKGYTNLKGNKSSEINSLLSTNESVVHIHEDIQISPKLLVNNTIIDPAVNTVDHENVLSELSTHEFSLLEEVVNHEKTIEDMDNVSREMLGKNSQIQMIQQEKLIED